MYLIGLSYYLSMEKREQEKAWIEKEIGVLFWKADIHIYFNRDRVPLQKDRDRCIESGVVIA